MVSWLKKEISYLEGKGTYSFENGDFYSGEFIDGKMNGEGVYFTNKVHLESTLLIF